MEQRRDGESGLALWFDIVWKHKWLVVAFAVLVLTATTVFTRRQTRIYEATTQIVIDLNAPRYMPQSGAEVVSLGTGNSWNTTEFFETQYRIITSRMVAKMVVERLGLAYDTDFLGADRIEDAEARARFLEHVDPISVLTRRVSVEPVPDSHVVLIKARDHDPARAARVADAVARAYADQNVNRKVSAATEAVGWLKQQAESLKTDAAQAENELLEFKREHGILSASLGDKQNLLGLDLQDARRQLREARAEASRLKSELDQVRTLSAEEALTSVEAVLGNGLVQRLKEQLVEAQNQKSELLKRYLEKHPDVQTAERKIERVRKALQVEVAGIRRSLERKYKAALDTERAMARDAERLEEQARAMHGHELEYKRLEALVQSTKDLYNQMLFRLKEAQLQADSRANNVRVLDDALVPEAPVAPRLVLNLVVAAVLALVGGLGLVFLVEQLDSTVKSQEQLEREFGLTFLGIIPSVRSARSRAKGGRFEGPVKNPDRYVLENPHSTAAECVRTIRTNLMFMSPERELRSILVTSAGPREGKTSTCVNVGATMAMSGSRILLVDSDMRRPRLHKIFDMTNDRGLTNLVMDPERTIASVVKDSGIENMDVLCSGPLPPNPSELLHTKGFRATLDRLLAAYDRIIFDSPPVGAVTDAQILGQQIDGAIIVVRAGETTRVMLRKAARLLSDVNVNILGALLNHVDVSRRGYGRAYYQYYRQHGVYVDETPGDAESSPSA